MSENTAKRRYRAKMVVGHDADGRAVLKYASGHTRKELEAQKAHIKKMYAIEAAGLRPDMTVCEYVQDWYDLYKKPRIGASSRSNYAAAIQNHILPFIGPRPMRSVTAGDLQRILDALSGRGKTLISYTSCVIRGAFAKAYADGLLDRDPSAGLIRPQSSSGERRELTPQETAAALQVARTHPDGLLLAILFYTGLRRGEALGLRWGDIDFTAATLHVQRDVDFITNRGDDALKTPAANRVLPIPGELTAMLLPRRGPADQYVLRAPMGGFWPQATYVRRWRALRAAMLQVDPTIESACLDKTTGLRGSILTAHYFRHNYATILFDGGFDVMAMKYLLGHAKITTTLKIYTHLSEQRKKRIQLSAIQQAFRQSAAAQQGAPLWQPSAQPGSAADAATFWQPSAQKPVNF